MNARLKELINTADDGLSDALTLKPNTLKLLLQEIEKMCNSSPTILCEPVAGGPGFIMKLKDAPGTGTADSTYTLSGVADTTEYDALTPFADYWDLTLDSFGKDTSNVDLSPTYDSVLWRGPRITQRIISRAYTIDLSGSDSGAPGTIDIILREYQLISRDVTLNSIGEKIKISVESVRRTWRAWDFDGVLPP